MLCFPEHNLHLYPLIAPNNFQVYLVTRFIFEQLIDVGVGKEANAEEGDSKELSATEAEELAEGLTIKGTKLSEEEEEKGGKKRRRVIAKK